LPSEWGGFTTLREPGETLKLKKGTRTRICVRKDRVGTSDAHPTVTSIEKWTKRKKEKKRHKRASIATRYSLSSMVSSLWGNEPEIPRSWKNPTAVYRIKFGLVGLPI